MRKSRVAATELFPTHAWKKENGKGIQPIKFYEQAIYLESPHITSQTLGHVLSQPFDPALGNSRPIYADVPWQVSMYFLLTYFA